MSNVGNGSSNIFHMKTFKWFCESDNGQGISTFIPNVETVIEVKYENKTVRFVKIVISFQGGETREVEIKVSDIEKLNWNDIDERCVINSLYKYARRCIDIKIRCDLPITPVETKYGLDRLGIYQIENEAIYFAGNRVICNPNSFILPKLRAEKSQFCLDIDETLELLEIYDGMNELIKISPDIGRLLVSYTILGLTWAAYEKTGVTYHGILYILGKSGMLKSHYVPFMTQLYNRSQGIGPVTRFNSTKRYIEDEICKYRECTVVVDDLHTAESKSIRRANEESAEEIIRRLSDNMGRGHKEGNELVQNDFKGNVIFIGEYVVGSKSTIPRMLVADMSVKPDGGILDKYQREKPLIVSTFYYYFIKWYVRNFEIFIEKTSAWLKRFREDTKGSNIHGRLLDVQFCLNMAYYYYLVFCEESRFISPEIKENEMDRFALYVKSLVKEQQAWMDKEDRDKSNCYLKTISKLYMKGKFRLAEKPEQYDPNKHDGLIYYKCLCLRREMLAKFMEKEYPRDSIKKIIKELDNQNALKIQSEGKKTVKISKLREGVGSLRFYAIWLDKLN
jgi:hypothetical protein